MKGLIKNTYALYIIARARGENPFQAAKRVCAAFLTEEPYKLWWGQK